LTIFPWKPSSSNYIWNGTCWCCVNWKKQSIFKLQWFAAGSVQIISCIMKLSHSHTTVQHSQQLLNQSGIRCTQGT
jgi:hypothetical protein